MDINEFLNKIRAKDIAASTTKRRIGYLLFYFILGVILGFAAKYVDSVRPSGWLGDFINILSDIGSRIEIWVVIATAIAVWARTPGNAAIHVFVFFIGLLLAYYIYSMILFGFFPRYYFLRWGLIALLSPLAVYVVWYGRGEGWAAAICTAIPIGLLVSQGYSFLYTFRFASGFDLLAAIVLFLIIPSKKYQYLKMLPVVLVISFLIRRLELLSYIIGGL